MASMGIDHKVSTNSSLSICYLTQVKAWAKGKEKNIRALISSLHLILWEGETRWTEIGMHQLVQPEEVTQLS